MPFWGSLLPSPPSTAPVRIPFPAVSQPGAMNPISGGRGVGLRAQLGAGGDCGGDQGAGVALEGFGGGHFFFLPEVVPLLAFPANPYGVVPPNPPMISRSAVQISFLLLVGRGGGEQENQESCLFLLFLLVGMCVCVCVRSIRFTLMPTFQHAGACGTLILPHAMKLWVRVGSKA